MIYFTKYADKKFEILNKYGVYFTKEQIVDCFKYPEKKQKKNKYITYEKENIKIIIQKENNKIKILTFFPIKK